VLQRALDNLCVLSSVFGASVIFIDQKNRRAIDMICGGRDRVIDLDRVIRPDGYSMKALESNEPFLAVPDLNIVREQLNPATLREEIRSALCFPLSGPDGKFGRDVDSLHGASGFQ